MTWRDINFIREVKSSLVFKFLSVLISFLLVRLLLKYLGASNYGLWSVILTFLNWVIFFDLGITNGVKNKLSESLSKSNKTLGKKYISTGYIATFSFSIISYLIILIFSFLIDWQSVFNEYNFSNDYLRELVLIILFFTLLNFSLSMINAVFNAVQKASLITVNQFLTQVFTLTSLFILIRFTQSDLHTLALLYGCSMLISNILLSIWFYSKNKELLPEFKAYDKTLLKPILSLGLRFFILQTTMMVILTTDRFIIVHLTNAEEVAKYDVINRYFNILLIIHTLINTPLWPMYTEAYHKGDYNWLERIMRKMFYLGLIYVMAILIMIFVGEFVLEIWLGENVLEVLKSNFAFMGVLVFFNICHSILAYFTNGIGKTSIQLITSLLGAILNIPISIFLVNYFNLGINGVMIATIICLSFFCIIGPFQVIKEIRILKTNYLNAQKNE
ncbi:oligosaccharide flippase family protein [Tamlana sp. 2201CG12-4]|uniref:oligosaccharide flippase family protein n=1 Tax=Tamlana sp. 2201CG12-4 TaxID=3112582 RepID=UPI002DBCB507|nr:oligosaccharide flippase family protein [Tamlana sp. 2201CG12-4]MEC3906298.1 oligosaccharide flippase family protein [Tamlana sp. 2201CG12-4]